MSLGEEIKKEMSRNSSIYSIKANLIKRGFLDSDIDDELRKMINKRAEDKNKNNKILSINELFSRIGYGFASQQFVNILFMLSGASLFLIGLFNGIKTALGYFLSGFLKEYSKLKYIGKSFISTAGIIYGFSFLGMSFSVVLRSPLLFAISMLAGTIGIIAHGDLYLGLYNSVLKAEKRQTFLRFISYFGIIITAISLFAAGALMQLFPITGYRIVIDLEFLNLVEPIIFRVFGYLLAFEITAVMFILSSYLLSFLDEKSESFQSDFQFYQFIGQYIKQANENTSVFRKNKKIFLLMLATIVTTIVQVLINSYTGIFIFDNFKDEFLKGFLNVAFIFVIALIASISGTVLTKKFAKALGEAPMLVFGTLLMALLPVTLYFNPNLYSISLAMALSVIGGAIVGVAQGLIAERLMNEKEITQYFSSLGFVSILPVMLLVPIGAAIAQAISLQMLFLILALILGAIVMPLYFIIVIIVDGEYRKERR